MQLVQQTPQIKQHPYLPGQAVDFHASLQLLPSRDRKRGDKIQHSLSQDESLLGRILEAINAFQELNSAATLEVYHPSNLKQTSLLLHQAALVNMLLLVVEMG